MRKSFDQQRVTSAIPGHSVHLVYTGTWRGACRDRILRDLLCLLHGIGADPNALKEFAV